MLVPRASGRPDRGWFAMARPQFSWPVAVVVAVGLCLAGCGGGNAGGTSATASGSAATSEGASSSTDGGGGATAGGSDGLPPVDTGGAESPQPRQQDQPSIDLPALPVGGGTTDGRKGPDQCLSANWRGGDGTNVIPTGVRATVRTVVFRQPRSTGSDLVKSDLFEVGGSACGSQGPSCLHLTFGPGDQTASCFVPVRQVRDPSDVVDVTVTLDGRVTCGTQSVCDSLRQTWAQGSLTGLQAQPGVVHPSSAPGTAPSSTTSTSGNTGAPTSRAPSGADTSATATGGGG